MLFCKITILTLLLIITCFYANGRYKHKHKAKGIASYYSNKYEGRKTATGDVFSNKGYTAASNKFRLGAYTKVTDRSSGKHVYVKINDRMGNGDRLIDLTEAATDKLGFRQKGLTHVRVKVVKDRKGKRAIRRQ